MRVDGEITRRAEIKGVLHALYAARLANDPRRVMAFFADNAVFELVGSVEASPIACRVEAPHALHSVMVALCETWEWRSLEVETMLIDGDQAAISYRLDVRHLPSGRVVQSQIVDIATLRGSEVVHFKEFVDTAMVLQLSS
ncbi:MAG: nuclear transport factor 2 family protein [Pseudomonadota bacterium]